MLRDRLQELLEPVIEDLGYELVLLEFAPQTGSALLRLFIDSEEGITLEDCETVSREVAGVLDVNDPITSAYQLEVSSPGLDRPLTKPQHFLRFLGEDARIQLLAPRNGRKRFSGRIDAATDSSVTLFTDLGVVELEYSTIERARLIPDFDKGKP
ncbi:MULTISPECIES: ribosome maturation factor RimP [Hydrocarboniphaga]|uniref:ribosome maturation factor RimP n=1 Tax=Hydrocarboniphaga TaxID=243627 RepID=UPI001ED95A2F|nr:MULTISPECIES: ribosome maturation factor RimP [Hydrocarboniphaga]MDZ4078599.1 ribosome maturation factor RimP [Hydrocarboniphaga sp.]